MDESDGASVRHIISPPTGVCNEENVPHQLLCLRERRHVSPLRKVEERQKVTDNVRDLFIFIRTNFYCSFCSSCGFP